MQLRYSFFDRKAEQQVNYAVLSNIIATKIAVDANEQEGFYH